MTTEDRINKLATIKVIIANPTVTYDMGMQFDVLTAKGALTTMGNVGQWPYMKFKISQDLKILQNKVANGTSISEEEVLENDTCRELCTYHDMLNGCFLLHGDMLSKCIRHICESISVLELSGEDLYVYAEIEGWNLDIRFYTSYEDMCKDALSDWEEFVRPYSEMTNEEIESWYEIAKANDWNGIPLYSVE